MSQPEIVKQLAENIAKYRKALGMTQVQLAEKISVEKETVSRMEAGKVTPSLARLAALAAALQCPVSALVRDTSEGTKMYAETIADMLGPLPRKEQEAIVRFVGDTVRLFGCREE